MPSVQKEKCTFSPLCIEKKKSDDKKTLYHRQITIITTLQKSSRNTTLCIPVWSKIAKKKKKEKSLNTPLPVVLFSFSIVYSFNLICTYAGDLTPNKKITYSAVSTLYNWLRDSLQQLWILGFGPTPSV